jgi:hypothetical protein
MTGSGASNTASKKSSHAMISFETRRSQVQILLPRPLLRSNYPIKNLGQGNGRGNKPGLSDKSAPARYLSTMNSKADYGPPMTLANMREWR